VPEPSADPAHIAAGTRQDVDDEVENSAMATVVVGEARAEEAEQLASMYEWLFAPPGAPPPGWTTELAVAAIHRAMSSESTIVLVARLETELVGFCTAYDDIESVRFGRRVWVEDLAVHPDHRSGRIGKQLLDEAKRWARARRAARLHLESAEARTAAHRFYEREQPSWRSLSFGWEL
jgi:GNAT superfamily N-acetyltransferase